MWHLNISHPHKHSADELCSTGKSGERKECVSFHIWQAGYVLGKICVCVWGGGVASTLISLDIWNDILQIKKWSIVHLYDALWGACLRGIWGKEIWIQPEVGQTGTWRALFCKKKDLWKTKSLSTCDGESHVNFSLHYVIYIQLP